MKSPFPGWEQGTILEMRDDPEWLQAFLGGCANARAEGQAWFVTPVTAGGASGNWAIWAGGVSMRVSG